ARWTTEQLLVEAPEWPAAMRNSWEAAAVLRSIHAENSIDQAWFSVTRDALGWIAAIERRRDPSLMPARLISWLTSADELLLRPLALGDNAQSLALREAAAELLLEADEVRGDAARLERFKDANWKLAAARPAPHPEIDETTKVSAIVAHRDLPKYLGECLASLRAQSVVPEIIVVDDGSGPEGAAAVRREQAIDPAIKIIWQQSAGPSEARNAGA